VKAASDGGSVGQGTHAVVVVSVAKVAERTVRLTLTDVYAPFADSTTVPLLPAHLLGNLPYAELPRNPFNTHPIGTGPFRVSDVDNRQVTLTRSETFYRTRPARTRPYLDKVVLRFYPSPTEALFAPARGETAGVAGAPTHDAERARALTDVVRYSLP